MSVKDESKPPTPSNQLSLLNLTSKVHSCRWKTYGQNVQKMSTAKVIVAVPIYRKKNRITITFFFVTFFFREIRKISNCPDRAETFQKVASQRELSNGTYIEGLAQTV